MSFGCYFIVTSQTTFKSISGEGTVVINGEINVTVNDFKGGIIQLNNEKAKVIIVQTSDLSNNANSKYQKKIVGKGTTVIKPQSKDVTINLDMIGSTSLAVESVQQYFKLVVGTLYLNKDIDVGKYCELSVSQLTSTVTNEKRSIKTSGKRMVITEIDADLYRLVEPTQVIISAVPITETYSNVVKCTLDGTFVTGTDLVCPCQSLTGYECELEFTGSTNPITFPSENIALHKLTLPSGATISGTGSLSVMNLEIKGDVTINGFSSVDINSQTGESKITISTNGKLKGTKSKTVTFSPSSSSVKLEYYGTSVETLTVDKEGTFINSGNNIKTVTLSNSGKYTVPEGITVNSGTINVCPTCVVNINGEYTESLKIQSTGTKDNTNNDYNVIFGMFKDFVEKVVTSTGTNKITFHPSGKKVIFKEMDYSSTNELIDGCDYTNTFLEGDKIQGENIEIDTGNVEFRVGKIQMNKLTIQKESNISFIGIKNTSTIENIVLIKPGTTSILVKDGVNPLTLKINNDNNTLNSITLQNSSRVIISNTQTTINLGEVNIENSQLYLDSGNYEFNEKTINFLVNSNDFMMVMGPSTQINSNSREIKTMNFNIKIEKELEGPIYLLRTSYQNFISRFGVKFTITSNNHLKGEPTNSIDSKYELTQVCRIYVALVPKGYTITECPKDPCGTNEAGIFSQITTKEVPTWAIAVIVIVGVIIVIALILLVAFILYAKLVLLKNRKNNKVFDDTENVFCQTPEETTEHEESQGETESSETSGSGSDGSSKTSQVSSVKEVDLSQGDESFDSEESSGSEQSDKKDNSSESKESQKSDGPTKD
ncbi:hypothetical protein CL6EHI_185450 [Entamoeba histolytica]|uniref:Uncharacterized protein n=1 Tax=Entamoeba histolytica TaxID=5759 RepID=A0A175JWW3_ENTHI|nr:hypothetical protein CL6EHI_185450 [Entamoeba histolytica]